MTDYTATYSPEDNKLRLYASSRLDSETYAAVKAAGFKWAPKQELFVAPMWTPGREDMLMDLCGEIGDEDTSLVDRAEQRAERFEDYSEKRAADAESAHRAVASIAGGIPPGQPILVGHHGERRARKDAERIERGMEKAVNMWRTSKYWTSRAAGAVHAAKYKELPAVRARRIKKLEAERRKAVRERDEAALWLKLWTVDGLTLELARELASRCWLSVMKKESGGYSWTAHDVLEPDETRYTACPSWTVEQVQEVARRVYPRAIANRERWLEHYDNRLAYEKAMLDEQGGSDLLKPKPRPKQLPLCNYRAPAGISIENRWSRGHFETYQQVEMTKAEYAAIYSESKGTETVDHSHRVRTFYRSGVNGGRFCVFLTDSKTHERPAPVEPTPPREIGPSTAPSTYTPPERTKFDDMADTLQQGVEVVTAPQLFPTPTDVAERMVELADIERGHSVLEPSAGTGQILRAIREATGGGAVRTAVELNYSLVDRLRIQEEGAEIIQGDFLTCDGSLGQFDRILMNPPFERGADIKHITHALGLLKPGGRLVAICANGPRQQAALRPLAENSGGDWFELPPDTFKVAGTGVRTALMVINA